MYWGLAGHVGSQARRGICDIGALETPRECWRAIRGHQGV